MKTKKILSLLFCSLFFGSCALFREKIPPYPEGIMFPLVKDGEIDYKGQTLDRVFNDSGLLYFVTRAGSVNCIDAGQKKPVWTYETGERAASPVYVGRKSICLYDQKNTLYCLDKAGSLLWKKEFKAKITSGILERRNVIHVGTRRGNFYGLNILDGKQLWRFKAEGAILSDPVISQRITLIGCEDGYLYFLKPRGVFLQRIKLTGKVRSPMAVDGEFVFFGTDDGAFYCIDFIERKKKWRADIVGVVRASPVTDQKRVFFITWQNVIYCLNKRNGTVLWWNNIPGRSVFDCELIGDRIVVSSFSRNIVCFDVKSGEQVGRYEAPQDSVSNPAWLKPHLIINFYDHKESSGKIYYLKKDVRVELSPSKLPPQKMNTEVELTADALGFFRPKYEFYIKEGEKITVAQEKSDEKTLMWYPAKDRFYIIKVTVEDEKEKASDEIFFPVGKRSYEVMKRFYDLLIFGLEVSLLKE